MNRSPITVPTEVRIPAVLLFVLAIVMMLGSLAAYLTYGNVDPMLLRPELAEQGYVSSGNLVPRWVNLVWFALNALIGWGATRMWALKGYRIAVAACVLAMIPCVTNVCCLFGFPVGLWGLIVLMKPEVKAAFHSARSKMHP